MNFQDNIKPERILNAISLDKKHSYLLVEGNSDSLLYGKFISKEDCKIKAMNGNVYVIAALKTLQERGCTHIIGIIDADFRRLDNDIPAESNLFLTDSHDLELMILQSPAFETVLDSFCENPQEETDSSRTIFEKKAKKPVKEVLLSLAKPLAYLKKVNQEEKYEFRFKPNSLDKKEKEIVLDYSKFIDKEKLTFKGNDVLIATIKTYKLNEHNPNKKIVDLATKMQAVENRNYDLLELCNGHDVICVLSLALLKVLAKYDAKKREVEPSIIEEKMILAYDSADFKETNLFQSIKNWEKEHPPYLILSQRLFS